jgi:uncharacterized membrane protein YhfC
MASSSWVSCLLALAVGDRRWAFLTPCATLHALYQQILFKKEIISAAVFVFPQERLNG